MLLGAVTHWLIRDRVADLRIELGFHAGAGHKGSDTSRREINSLLRRGLHAGDLEVRRALEAIYRELRGISAPDGAHAPDFERSLAHDLRFAAFTGRLRVVRVERPRGGGEALAPVVPQRVLAPEAEPDAWIAIELVDEDNEPVPNVAYRIECSDGRVRTGTTNAAGKARAEGLHYGSCTVSFPELNAPDWKKVG